MINKPGVISERVRFLVKPERKLLVRINIYRAFVSSIHRRLTSQSRRIMAASNAYGAGGKLARWQQQDWRSGSTDEEQPLLGQARSKSLLACAKR